MKLDIFAYTESENMRPEPFKARFILEARRFFSCCLTRLLLHGKLCGNIMAKLVLRWKMLPGTRRRPREAEMRRLWLAGGALYLVGLQLGLSQVTEL